MNDRLTVKERNLLKGAIRRVFSRSDLRKAVIEASRIKHHDSSRPRVTKWSVCATCKAYTPTYLMECDHVVPIVPIDRTLADMSWDEVVDRVWCALRNLSAVCKPCHKIKTKEENKARRDYKKSRLK